MYLNLLNVVCQLEHFVTEGSQNEWVLRRGRLTRNLANGAAV